MKKLNQINITGLRAVESVGRLGNLRMAADELSVTPGAVSQQVQKIEAQLGCILFDRKPKGLEVTLPGREVMRHLTNGMLELTAAITVASQHQKNKLTISSTPGFAAKWLIPRLKKFNKIYPNIRIQIYATRDIVDPNMPDVDVCIRLAPKEPSGVIAKKLIDATILPVCSPALASQINSPSDLSKIPAIHINRVTLPWNSWLKTYGMDETQLADGPTFSDSSLCLDAAIAGQGVFLSCALSTIDALNAGTLVAPLPNRRSSGFSYWYLTGEHSPKLKYMRDFEAWLRKELENSYNTKLLHTLSL